MNGIDIHAYAIVSRDDRIADAYGVMPAALRNEADWEYFQAELDRADWIALGRASHEATPNLRRRRRLILSNHARGLERREDGWWWRPDAVAFEQVAELLMPGGGRLGVPGGQGAFDLFLRLGLTAFHLARAETVDLPGGKGVFAGVENGETAGAILARAGLTSPSARWLDAEAQVSLSVYSPH